MCFAVADQLKNCEKGKGGLDPYDVWGRNLQRGHAVMLNYAGDAGDLVIRSAAYSVDNGSMEEGASLLQTRR